MADRMKWHGISLLNVARAWIRTMSSSDSYPMGPLSRRASAYIMELSRTVAAKVGCPALAVRHVKRAPHNIKKESHNTMSSPLQNLFTI